ncbi:ribonuclease P protein component [Neptunitalea chrysea]|uniref:Ribonuclease P protein component n=1 Tax=Neptunitalea chrysea TaxID=1647581 RepID=A0A9W6B6X5_9FLAO|nr:ribonuclease P protein component [Neptunitalea chrysea]GLB52937.1 ribonuclease P protein component [Neptunitalea chrysea]
MDFSFPKDEKLKSKILIQKLFSEGSAVSKYPIKLVYIEATPTKDVLVQAGFSVPKRFFKKAVDRNRIKRLLREAYRLQKTEQFLRLQKSYVFMFIYTGKELPDFEFIQKKMSDLSEKFIQNELNIR